MVCGPRLPLPMEVLRELCQYVSAHCTGPKADGPETSPGWPCFLGPTLRSWEAVPCAVLGSDMDTRPLISQMPTESEPMSVWQM